MSSTSQQVIIKNTKNSKKPTKPETIPLSNYTVIKEMQEMYKNSTAGIYRRTIVQEYLNFVKDQMLTLSKEEKNQLKISFPFIPNKLILKKTSFFIVPINILRKSDDIYSLYYIIETHCVQIDMRVDRLTQKTVILKKCFKEFKNPIQFG
jgi:hypothetical protein